MEDSRYPIGKFKALSNYSDNIIRALIDDIENAPADLRKAVAGLNEEQLNTPYREGGWTVKQVVHHLPDSHINAYVRFKLALTEEEPLIKTYNENLWANLKDSSETPIEISLQMLEMLHKRWTILLRSLSENDLERKYRHPDYGGVTLKWVIAQYAWHGKHHIAHITSLRKRMNW